MKIRVYREYHASGWVVPDFVRVEDAKGKSDTVPLGEVDTADLSLLCDEWRAQVFAAAQKPDPRLAP